MRKVLMLAAMLIAPALAPAEAGDRGHRHFAPHHGTGMTAPPPGMRFHGGHFDHHRHFAPHRFGRLGHFEPRRFGHHGHFEPHRFGHPRSGFMFRFHSGSFGFGPGPRFHRPHFRSPRPHFGGPFLGGPAFRFGQRPQVHAWRFAPHHPPIWREHAQRHR